MKKLISNYFPRHKWTERVEQLIILLAHLFLLKWILYALSEGGTFTMIQMVEHFAGMAVYGSLLIWGTSVVTKRRFLKNQEPDQDA